jgi:hypothetical protein
MGRKRAAKAATEAVKHQEFEVGSSRERCMPAYLGNNQKPQVVVVNVRDTYEAPQQQTCVKGKSRLPGSLVAAALRTLCFTT